MTDLDDRSRAGGAPAVTVTADSATMAPATPVHYWSADALTAALDRAGFVVRRHLMVDLLPYPHVLYVCEARP